MPIRPARAAVASPALRDALPAATAFLAAAAAWLAAMTPQLLAQARFGPICSGHGGAAVHCPACYAAAGLVGIGLALSVRAAARTVRR